MKLRVHSKNEDYRYFVARRSFTLPSGAEVIKSDWAFKIRENDYAGWLLLLEMVVC
ncbi:MAG: hypothetical protein R2942_04155 [Ignavibacteria bacterium]